MVQNGFLNQRHDSRKERSDMVFAVDFDGTISLGDWPSVGPANIGLIEFLIRKEIN